MSNIGKVVVSDSAPLGKDDPRRTIYLAFDKNCDFQTAEEATIIVPKLATVLGNHWHNFKELFVIVKGGATFYLEDIDDRMRTERIVLAPFQRIMIPPRVAHAFTISEGSIILAYLEKPFEPPIPFFLTELSF